MKNIMKMGSLYLPEFTWEALRAYSIKQDRPVNWTIKNILNKWIKRNLKQCGAMNKKKEAAV
jgi:hypothetical protein